MCEERHGPSLRAVFSNWKNSDAPFWDKVKMALKNNYIKFKKRQNCCGNPGQVGC